MPDQRADIAGAALAQQVFPVLSGGFVADAKFF